MKKTSLSLITLLESARKHDRNRRYPWTHYFEKVSEIHADRVRILREALAKGTWKPDPIEIAERMLSDHLSDPSLISLVSIT